MSYAVQGRHRVPDHDRGAALAAAGSVRPPDRDLTRRERAGSRSARWSSRCRGWSPRWRRASSATSCTSSSSPRSSPRWRSRYDLVVGHVGSLSLAHPAFFGIGAYTAAIPPPGRAGPSSSACVGAVLAAAVVAALVGVPLFRLAEHAFAVGTAGPGARRLGRGEQLGRGHARSALHHRDPQAAAQARWPSRRCRRFYWLAPRRAGGRRAVLSGADDVPAAGARSTRCATTSRSPAPPASIRLKYRLLAFTLAARDRRRHRRALRPLSVGHVPGGDDRRASRSTCWSSSSSVASAACAACCSAPSSSPALPEVLRLAPTWRLVIYGGLLLLVVIRSPGGIGEPRCAGATGAR